MSGAIAAGKPLCSVDSVLLEVPAESRASMLLNPREHGRQTRDRSFEIESLKNCRTKPFFYPLLPFCMNGLDVIVPGNAADFFVPLMGLIFSVVLLLAGIRLGGNVAGSLVVLMLLVGSPLIAWLFRGAYLETVAGILLSLAILPWIASRGKPLELSWLQFFAAGLAVSFHPVMIVLAVPLAGAMALEGSHSLRRLCLFAGAFAAGLLPLVFLTIFVATPYGSISRHNLADILLHSSSIRPTMVAVSCLAFLVIAGQVGKKWIMSRVSLEGWRNNVLSAVLFAAWILPVLLAVRYWEQGQGHVVLRGFSEMLDGLQLPFGVALLSMCLVVLVSRNSLREKICLTFVFLSLPLFLYLKGAENMGLWSQRRLIASLLIVITCCMPVSVGLVARAIQTGLFRTARCTVVVLLILFVGAHNAVRWPAPYLVRYEDGSGAWVHKVGDVIGAKLAFFDYHPYSVPFAVKPGCRALGLSEFGHDGLPGIIKWLGERATQEDVLLFTAYDNPGMEEGIILIEKGRESGRFEIAHSKTALPAVRRWREVDMRILEISAVSAANMPVLCKVLDDGPLAIREPWGRGSPIKADGLVLPARWSREGSGIVGPVPLPGGSVKISLEAAASRDDGVDGQVLRIVPPWGSEGLSLAVSNNLVSVSGILVRPSEQKDYGSLTGVYRIYADKPYDPAKVGKKGYNSDLGARIHLVRIEAVSFASNKNEKSVR